MKKYKRESEPTGNDIQIYIEDFIANRPLRRSYRLRVISLGFQSTVNYRWEGIIEQNKVWVEFDLKTNNTVFSENYPTQFENDARVEVKRITRQFN